jgi:L-ascorbate metabolism protein UlaG (beta-lactamase superfamily)
LVEVTWFGHACFMLKEKKIVVFDPFKGTGLPEPKASADIVLCSHSHSDHNNIEPVKHAKSIVLEGFAGKRQIDDISVRGIATFHDDTQGGKRGKNSVYIVSLDGINFCHLGDLGHTLSISQISEIGSVDVLFLPVGGFYTIGPGEARKVMETIKPKITVPMHYRMSGMSTNFDKLSTINDFLRADDNVRKLDEPSFAVTKADLLGKMQIIVPKLN